MKNFLKITMLVAGVITLYSCGDNANQAQSQPQEGQAVEAPADTEKKPDSLETSTTEATKDSGAVVKEEVKK